MGMVKIEASNKDYEECNSCGSTLDVYHLKIGRENMTVIKLCNECRLDVIDLLKDITER